MKLFKDFGVRALLATLVVGVACIASIILIALGEYALGFGFLSNGASMALGFYFGTRSNQGGTP